MECCSKSDEKIDDGGVEGCHMTEGVLHGPTRRNPKICLFFPDFLLLCGQLLQGLSLPGYPANWIDFWGQNILKYYDYIEFLIRNKI